jgi:hypothetical protein
MGKLGRLVKRVTGIKKLGGGSRPPRDAEPDDRERGGGVAASMPPRRDPPVSPPAPRGDAPAGASFSSEEESPPEPRGDKLAALLRQGVRIDESPATPHAAIVSLTSPFPAPPSPFASPPRAIAAPPSRAPATARGDENVVVASNSFAGSPFGSPAARASPFTPTATFATLPEEQPNVNVFVADFPDVPDVAGVPRARGAETTVDGRSPSPSPELSSPFASPSPSPFASPFASPDAFAARAEARRARDAERRAAMSSSQAVSVDPAARERAAVTLQARARGFLARAAARRRRAARRAAALRETYERERAAATVIQAFVRGRAARRFAETTRRRRGGERRVAAIEAELAALRAAVVANASYGGSSRSPEFSGDWRRARATTFTASRKEEREKSTPPGPFGVSRGTVRVDGVRGVRRATDASLGVASDASPSASGSSPPDAARSSPESSSPELWRSPASTAAHRRSARRDGSTAAKRSAFASRREMSPGSRVVAAAEALARRYHESPLWDVEASDATERRRETSRLSAGPPASRAPLRDARARSAREKNDETNDDDAYAYRSRSRSFAPSSRVSSHAQTPRTPRTPYAEFGRFSESRASPKARVEKASSFRSDASFSFSRDSSSSRSWSPGDEDEEVPETTRRGRRAEGVSARGEGKRPAWVGVASPPRSSSRLDRERGFGGSTGPAASDRSAPPRQSASAIAIETRPFRRASRIERADASASPRATPESEATSLAGSAAAAARSFFDARPDAFAAQKIRLGPVSVAAALAVGAASAAVPWVAPALAPGLSAALGIEPAYARFRFGAFSAYEKEGAFNRAPVAALDGEAAGGLLLQTRLADVEEKLARAEKALRARADMYRGASRDATETFDANANANGFFALDDLELDDFERELERELDRARVGSARRRPVGRFGDDSGRDSDSERDEKDSSAFVGSPSSSRGPASRGSRRSRVDRAGGSDDDERSDAFRSAEASFEFEESDTETPPPRVSWSSSARPGGCERRSRRATCS